MKKLKEVFHVEYNLTSTEFKNTEMEKISKECQTKHGDSVMCEITTLCVPDHQLVVHTTQENADFFGAPSTELGTKALIDKSLLTADDDMIKTWKIIITKDTDLPDYITAINLAQAKADKMFEEDDSKIPLVTVKDYRWGNNDATITASIFSTEDEDGNLTPLVGATDSAANVVLGDPEAGKKAAACTLYVEKWEDGVDDIFIKDYSNPFTYGYRVECDLEVTSDDKTGYVFGVYYAQKESYETNGIVLYIDDGKLYFSAEKGSGDNISVATGIDYRKELTHVVFDAYVAADGKKNAYIKYGDEEVLLEDTGWDTGCSRFYIPMNSNFIDGMVLSDFQMTQHTEAQA